MSIYFELDFDNEVYPISNANIKLYNNNDQLLKTLDKNSSSLIWEYDIPIASIDTVGAKNTIDINFVEDVELLWGLIKVYNSSNVLLGSVPSTSNSITTE